MSDKRQKKKRESKGAYWMDTYGDMVTLLLTFFIMLFASSQMNEAKWMQIVASFRGEPVGAIVDPIDPLNPTQGFTSSDYIPKPQPRDKANDVTNAQAQKSQEDFDKLYEQLKQYSDDKDLGAALIIEKTGETIFVTIQDVVLFDSGRASIREDAKQILIDLGNMFAAAWESVKILEIEGHTDSDPIKNAQFINNRDLSSKRALSVLLFMQENTPIPLDVEAGADRIKATGFGETQPIASNDTAEGKQKNRRVEFKLQSYYEG